MGIIGAFPPTGNYQLHSPLSHNRSPCSCTARLPPGTRKFIQQMGFVNILIVHVLGHCCSLSRDMEETTRTMVSWAPKDKENLLVAQEWICEILLGLSMYEAKLLFGHSSLALLIISFQQNFGAEITNLRNLIVFSFCSGHGQLAGNLIKSNPYHVPIRWSPVAQQWLHQWGTDVNVGLSVVSFN